MVVPADDKVATLSEWGGKDVWCSKGDFCKGLVRQVFPLTAAALGAVWTVGRIIYVVVRCHSSAALLCDDSTSACSLASVAGLACSPVSRIVYVVIRCHSFTTLTVTAQHSPAVSFRPCTFPR